MLKDVLKGAGGEALAYFPVRLVPALTSLVTVPVFTRLIEASDYGDFYLVNSAVMLASTVATAWVAGSAVRFYWTYEKEGRLDDYVGTSVWSTSAALAAMALLAALGVWVFRDALSDNLRTLAWIGIASLVVNHLVKVMLQMLRAANRAAPFATISIVNTLIGTALAVYFVAALQMGAFGIFFGIVLGNVAVAPFLLRRVGREGSLSPTGMKRDVLSAFAQYGVPLIPAAISSWILLISDRYVIGIMRTSAEVGLYSVAYGLGEKIMQLVTQPLILTMGPIIIRTFEKQGQELAQKVQTQFTRYFAMATLPLLAGLAAASHDFMAVFTGQEYRVAYPILGIVAAGWLCYGLTNIAGNGVALHRRSSIIMQNTFVAAAANLAANVALVPRFGYMAAAYTTLGSYVILLALTWVRSRPYMAWILPWADLGRIALASVLMAVAVVGVSVALPSTLGVLLLEIVVGLVVYVVLLLALGGVRADERAYVSEMAGKIRTRIGGRS